MKIMRKYMLFLLLPAGLLVSCKKNYTCGCGVNNQMDRVFDVYDTRKNAVQKCEDYYREKLPTINTLPGWKCELM